MAINHMGLVLVGLLLLVGTAGAQAMAHLEKHGTTTQLVVDGKPYLVLGGS